MRVVRDLSELHEPHRELLRRVVRSARKVGGTSVVITFDPHPAQVLAPEHAPKTLTPLALKTGLIEKEGIELLLILNFNRKLSRLSPEEFARNILVEKLRAAVVHVGSNFRFGHQRAGNTALLAELGRRDDFRVETLPMMTVRGHRVSSSQVRRMLAEGRVEVAGRMLGRPYAVSGVITTGEGVGHRQTVPTLNLSPVAQQLPKNGVYITRTRVGGKRHDSVTNVGHKPTFGHHRLTVESFLLDFRGESRTGGMEVEFLYRLRDEIKFPNAEALKQQIQRDVQRSLKFFRLTKALRGSAPRANRSTPARA
ncbi:MAG: bifunctional riboflavin kinase/FAD synthetase [Acidobacteriota bacterium]